MEKVFFKSKDGLRLCGIWHFPERPTTKVVVLSHGLTVDKDEEGIFVELAELLSNNGIAVFRFDFRGHGESEGKSIDTTIKGEVDDVESVIQLVKSNGYTSTGLLGASVGGGIVSLYAAENQKYIKCLCLWNPSLNYDRTFLHPVTPWLRNRRASMIEDLKNQGWTTVGSRKKAYGKQFFNEMSTIYPYKALLKISVPTIIIHGTNDKYVPYEDASKYVKNLKNGSFITIKDGEHGFQDRQSDRKIALKETLKFFLEYI